MSTSIHYDEFEKLEQESSDAGHATQLNKNVVAYTGRRPTRKPDYKYNEGKLLQEITDYINNTYGEHYSQNNYQATEFIIDGGHGTGFTIGNILKYAQRYGHKGTPKDWRKDLMKVIHYSIIALHVHDLQHNKD
jgi:hypothetical protein